MGYAGRIITYQAEESTYIYTNVTVPKLWKSNILEPLTIQRQRSNPSETFLALADHLDAAALS